MILIAFPKAAAKRNMESVTRLAEQKYQMVVTAQDIVWRCGQNHAFTVPLSNVALSFSIIIVIIITGVDKDMHPLWLWVLFQ